MRAVVIPLLALTAIAIADQHTVDTLAASGTAASHARPSTGELTTWRPSPTGTDLTVIPVRYQIAGTRYDDYVGVTRYRRGLFGHGWRITDPPGAVLRVANHDAGTITLAPGRRRADRRARCPS